MYLFLLALQDINDYHYYLQITEQIVVSLGPTFSHSLKEILLLESEYIKLFDGNSTREAQQLEVNYNEDEQAVSDTNNAFFYKRFQNTIKYNTLSRSNVFTVLATAEGKKLLRGHSPSWKIEWAVRESGNEEL